MRDTERERIDKRKERRKIRTNSKDQQSERKVLKEKIARILLR